LALKTQQGWRHHLAAEGDRGAVTLRDEQSIHPKFWNRYVFHCRPCGSQPGPRRSGHSAAGPPGGIQGSDLDCRRVARLPAGQRIDGIDLDEPSVLPERQRGPVGRVSQPSSPASLAVTTLTPSAASSPSTQSSSTVPRSRSRRDAPIAIHKIPPARRLARRDGEPGHVTEFGEDPAVAAEASCQDMALDIAGDVIRQAADDRRDCRDVGAGVLAPVAIRAGRQGTSLFGPGRRHGTQSVNRPVTGWHSLTDTERAASELVAQGLNNQQVADRISQCPHGGLPPAPGIPQAQHRLTRGTRPHRRPAIPGTP
jgi:hypothetical protein